MRIKKFVIKKFKSIEFLEIPISSYGKGKNKSSVAFLVGLNESGKSAILEAINYWYEEAEDFDYSDNFHKGSDENEDIRIEAILEIEDISSLQKKLADLLKLDLGIIEKIEIQSLINVTWLDANDSGNYYEVTISQDFPFSNYIYSKEKGIQDLRQANSIGEAITLTSINAESFLINGQKLLSKKDLEEAIASKAKDFFHSELPTIRMWKPKAEYLINGTIDLNSFMNKPNASVPLKNIFHINGIDTDQKIKAKVERALAKPENKAELQKELSKGITLYINKIWKEHKINIIINIDGSSCSVHVEDKDREYKYYSMDQRSDGFNQFISLILSLSTQNDNNELKNHIILLDEPEIHLHPSGVRYMRDELLKIGKNNILFVSTHSHYMVDTTTPERHYIVSKKQMKTEVSQIEEDTSMSDDQVLASAFGLSLFKELLPQNILVVEGGGDKVIISYVLGLLFEDFFYSIKAAGGASKVYGISSLLAQEGIAAHIILDDDKEGRDAKKEVLANLKEAFKKEQVLTFRDILTDIPDKSTIEDLLPQGFVKQFFEEEMNQQFTFEKNQPILFQIKNQNENLRNNKEQLNSKKVKLSDAFVKKYDTKKSIENEAPLLAKLINELVTRVRE